MNVQGMIRQVCVSENKGTAKHAVPQAALRQDHGLVGDAHAGPGHRQVSLLDTRDIDTMKAKGLTLDPGAFGENLVVSGLDLAALGIGTRLRAGGAELEITQLGKVCHHRCAIYYHSGDCIMPRTGIFACVVTGGNVWAGVPIEVVNLVSRKVIQAAVLTVSDRCSAGTAEDTAGPAVSAALDRNVGARIAWSGMVPDEAGAITETLKDLTERGLDLVCTVGGTGCGPRDVTPEATRAILAREVPGLAEAMRACSARTAPHALLQRGVCGIRGGTLIVNLPGSRKGAVENLSVTLPVLRHAVRLLRGDTAHPENEPAPDRASGAGV